MRTVSVRYFVRDFDAAINFYAGLLGFRADMHPHSRCSRMKAFSHQIRDRVRQSPAPGSGSLPSVIACPPGRYRRTR